MNNLYIDICNKIVEVLETEFGLETYNVNIDLTADYRDIENINIEKSKRVEFMDGTFTPEFIYKVKEMYKVDN
jgi:hypothetical protein